jgi:hypothetical protein
MQISFPFGYASSGEIAELYGSFIFDFLRKFPTDFHSGCSNLHSLQQGPVGPLPHSIASTLELFPLCGGVR